jgi:hypothetical protein
MAAASNDRAALLPDMDSPDMRNPFGCCLARTHAKSTMDQESGLLIMLPTGLAADGNGPVGAVSVRDREAKQHLATVSLLRIVGEVDG